MPSLATVSYAAASILLSISHGYRYGFDIMDCTGLPSGTVYPALRRLEDAGLVNSEWEKSNLAQRDQRPARKYYAVTIAGDDALDGALRRYPLLNRVASGLASEAASTAPVFLRVKRG